MLTLLPPGSGPGHDVLLGGGGQDRLYGQEGDDELTGGTDFDQVAGGEGGDTYFWDIGDAFDLVEETAGHAGMDLFVLGGRRQRVDTASGYHFIEEDDQIRITGLPGGGVQVDVDDGQLPLHGIEWISVSTGGGADTVTLGSLAGTGVEGVAVDLSQLGQPGASTPDTVTYQGGPGGDMVTVAGVLQSMPQTDLDDLNVSLPPVDQEMVQIVDATAADVTILIVNTDPASDRLTLQGLGGDDTLTVSAGSEGVRVCDLIGLTLDGGDGDDALRTVYGDTEVIGGGGVNTLTVEDDGAGSARRLLTLDPSSLLVQRADLAKDDLISYGGIDAFTLNLAAPEVGNELNVLGTIAGDVVVNGSDGSDDLFVEGLAGDMQVNLAAVDQTVVNTVTLGRRDGAAVSIKAGLDIHGSPGYDRLVVDSTSPRAGPSATTRRWRRSCC